MEQNLEYNIAFVILHYNTMDDTVNCVMSIQNNIDTKNYHIVIVDNCSPNQSGVNLQSLYNGASDITVILNDINLGFANGNNVGINYAKEKLKAYFICCLNNDILFLQRDFYNTLNNIYKKKHAAIIGPLVYLRDMSIQRSNYQLHDVALYEKQLNYLLNGSKEGLITYIKNHLLKITFIKKLVDKKKGNTENFFKYEHFDCLLHGCFIIFTPIFFEYFEGFDSRTFMFKEEELLYIQIKKYNLLSLYTPKLYIQHLEDGATNATYKDKKEKKEFYRINKIKSLKVVINELKN